MANNKISKTKSHKLVLLSIQDFNTVLKKDNQKTNLKIEQINQEITDTESWLSSVKKSRFYRLWQLCNLYKRIFTDNKNEE